MKSHYKPMTSQLKSLFSSDRPTMMKKGNSYAIKLSGERAWLHFGIASIAIVIFFGLALIEKASISQPWSLRRPIAATIVVVYLMLVITFSFYRLIGDLPKISDMLLTSFTTVVGVVIAFYFGSSAYVEGKRRATSKKEEEM